MSFRCKKIFVGGYTKSGTTFVGRAFDIINGVYAKGEEDYFRLMFHGVHDLARRFNANIEVVNKEVYDGFGSIPPIDRNSLRILQQNIFYHIFFGSKPMPEDCVVTVEKSPHNIFRLREINYTFPDAINVCVYRPAIPVFSSLIRHMRDHRDIGYDDPKNQNRISILENFCKRWQEYVEIIEQNRAKLKMVQYQSVADDTAGFLDFAQSDIIGQKLGLSAPVETLTKEHYLSTLPPEAREKSLVQTSANKVKLTDAEKKMITDHCRDPDITFDF
ncbi:sulfotransferase [Kordiimonas lipolytica]|uniref:Sulfotransferase n=1 Tax=Kordiimonas lipolytica TaxID=1662421 RepID=A0ABV8U7M9_9PROT|nr:sulfotransferase [Kordiimonas lipolytica]